MSELPERLRTVITTITVTVESDLDGSVSKGPQAQECQLHVHLQTDVAQAQPVGWLVDTQQ